MKSLILAMSAFVVLVTAAYSAEEINGIAVVVNDEIVTLRELSLEYDTVSREIAAKEGPLTVEAADNLRTKVLDSLVDRLLVKQKIAELKIVISEEEVRQSIEEVKKQNDLSQEGLVAALITQGMTFDQYKAQMKEKLERLRLMSQEVKSKINVTEQEMRDYYNDNLTNFYEDPSYRARHIFFKITQKDTNAEIKKVMAKAAAVSVETRNGSDFAALARKYSDDPGAASDGGDLGVFNKGDMLPEIEKMVLILTPGDISDLVLTAAGLHIIKLEETTPAKAKPFAKVKWQIDELLYRKKSEDRFNQWTNELRKGAAIDIKQ